MKIKDFVSIIGDSEDIIVVQSDKGDTIDNKREIRFYFKGKAEDIPTGLLECDICENGLFGILDDDAEQGYRFELFVNDTFVNGVPYFVDFQ